VDTLKQITVSPSVEVLRMIFVY